jgi:centromere protein I
MSGLKDVDAIEACVDLIDHVSSLAQSVVTATEDSSSAILSFYETVVDFAVNAVSMQISLPILGPPPQLVYLLIMSPSLSNLSRMCSIVVSYKQALEKKSNRTDKEANSINAYLMDVCNLIWRSRALEHASNVNPSAQGCLSPPDVSTELQAYLTKLDRDYRLQMIFGLSQHPVISSISQSAFAALQDESEATQGVVLQRHAGPVTSRSLEVLGYEGGMKVDWQQCRISMLKWMEARGVGGIKKLLFATMKNLMNA